MSRWMKSLICVPVVCLVPFAAFSQCSLSVNSGINSADTCVVMDLTITSNTTANLPQPFYNPVTQTTSNVLNIAPAVRTLHVEAGYDSSGGLIMNFWPTGTPVNPNTTDAEAIGFIRFAGGQFIVFGQDGNPLPLVAPSGVSTTWPLNLLGSNPSSSVLGNLVVPNIQSYASAMKASLTMQQNPTAAYVAPPASQGGTANWTYAPSGSNWIATELALTLPMSNGSATRTIQFANMTWYDNATNDAARATKGYTIQPLPTASTGNPASLTTQTPSPGPTVVNQLGGPQNVAFIHGLASDSSTWNRMAGWLNQDFRFGAEIIPTLSWPDRLSNQGNALINEMNSVGGTNYILIGHSQGGLISRYAAQHFQNQIPQPVKGVVSLDAPHQGAPLAIVGGVAITDGFQFLATGLWDTTGCVTPYDNFVCYMAALTYDGAPLIGSDFEADTVPALIDLTPGSQFLTQLNGTSENFAQAGIVSNTPMRWNETRILDNAFFGWAGCNNPDAGCGERAIAAYTGYTYDVIEADFFFSLFMEIIDPDDADYWDAWANYFADIMLWMDAVDGFWNAIVSGFSASDAIVPASSENYPYGSAIQYPIYGADSHTGATRSSYARSTLDQILLQQFNVPTQSSCSFLASPTSYSVSGNGGTSNFSLTTGAGCQWSAVSQAPWVTITSGSGGTSNGTVSFSVAANPVSIPRLSSIQVGNKSSSTSFTINESGACSYSLNPSFVGLAPGGGNATVQVTTQSNCQWSAVPNVTWLTITSGASGTGSGSFTLNAAPGTTQDSFSGRITVINQVLPVIVGSSVGTPGTGAVTITGSQSCTGYFPLSHNCMTWSFGTIQVAVNGYIARGTAYGGTLTNAGALASSMASIINTNSNSPVTATASGAKVSLTTKLKGLATNYSLSTSYTNGGSPAYFQGVPSGAYLSGGTD